MKNMKEGGPESIRDFMKSGNMLKWSHKNGALNLFVVIMYSLVDSIINSFSFSLRPFDPKRNVLTVAASICFNNKRLMALIISKRVFV